MPDLRENRKKKQGLGTMTIVFLCVLCLAGFYTSHIWEGRHETHLYSEATMKIAFWFVLFSSIFLIAKILSALFSNKG